MRNHIVAVALIGTVFLAGCSSNAGNIRKEQTPSSVSASSSARSTSASPSPTESPSPSPSETPSPTASPTPKPVVVETPANTGVYYKNCDEVRAAGAAPIHKGQPGYAAHLDRDGDGVACEPYKGKGNKRK